MAQIGRRQHRAGRALFDRREVRPADIAASTADGSTSAGGDEQAAACRTKVARRSRAAPIEAAGGEQHQHRLLLRSCSASTRAERGRRRRLHVEAASRRRRTGSARVDVEARLVRRVGDDRHREARPVGSSSTKSAVVGREARRLVDLGRQDAARPAPDTERSPRRWTTAGTANGAVAAARPSTARPSGACDGGRARVADRHANAVGIAGGRRVTARFRRRRVDAGAPRPASDDGTVGRRRALPAAALQIGDDHQPCLVSVAQLDRALEHRRRSGSRRSRPQGRRARRGPRRDRPAPRPRPRDRRTRSPRRAGPGRRPRSPARARPAPARTARSAPC